MLAMKGEPVDESLAASFSSASFAMSTRGVRGGAASAVHRSLPDALGWVSNGETGSEHNGWAGKAQGPLSTHCRQSN
jgi:hypothetical protein